jgi:hypothetical protein
MAGIQRYLLALFADTYCSALPSHSATDTLYGGKSAAIYGQLLFAPASAFNIPVVPRDLNHPSSGVAGEMGGSVVTFRGASERREMAANSSSMCPLI